MNSNEYQITTKNFKLVFSFSNLATLQQNISLQNPLQRQWQDEMEHDRAAEFRKKLVSNRKARIPCPRRKNSPPRILPSWQRARPRQLAPPQRRRRSKPTACLDRTSTPSIRPPP